MKTLKIISIVSWSLVLIFVILGFIHFKVSTKPTVGIPTYTLGTYDEVIKFSSKSKNKNWNANYISKDQFRKLWENKIVVF